MTAISTLSDFEALTQKLEQALLKLPIPRVILALAGPPTELAQAA
jgi:hypothetical protein